MGMGNINSSVIRITQAVGFLLKMSENKQNKMKMIKLLWAADRYHIRKYGRTITRTEYYAMPFGPVNSLANNILNFDQNYLNSNDADYIDDYLKTEGQYDIVLSDTSIEDDYLSESDKEALRFAYETFGGMDKFKLSKEISHKYPEWAKHKTVEKTRSSVKMDLLDFFENPEDDEYFVVDDELLEFSKEDFLFDKSLERA